MSRSSFFYTKGFYSMKPLQLLTSIVAGSSNSGKKSRTSHSSRRLMLEPLEERRLLAIVWDNEIIANGFDTYGDDEIYARALVNRAIDDWERVITDFNYDGDSNPETDNEFNLDISVGHQCWRSGQCSWPSYRHYIRCCWPSHWCWYYSRRQRRRRWLVLRRNAAWRYRIHREPLGTGILSWEFRKAERYRACLGCLSPIALFSVLDAWQTGCGSACNEMVFMRNGWAQSSWYFASKREDSRNLLR